MLGRHTIIIVGSVTLAASAAALGQLTPMEELGKQLFFDTTLSTPFGQSCAACHDPEVGFTGGVSEFNEASGVYPGATGHRFGNRKPPAAAYAGFAEPLHISPDEGIWEGGVFWDGRATGWTLGDPLAEQAMGPFLNPLEQNNPGMRQVVRKVFQSEYADLFEQVWGDGSLDPVKDVYGSYERIARAIAAYERSSEVNPFSSKYDYYLAGQATLTDQEMLGLQLFEGQAMCAACHLSQPDDDQHPALFTDYTYDNLGTPRNPDNQFYNMPPKWNPAGDDWVDYGLGAFLARAGYPPEDYEPELGKHKVPTLRNVALEPYDGFVNSYMHNGVFTTLEEVVHFYNTRDVEDWPEPEVPMNVNTDELGDLGLTPDEEAAIVAFLRTLSDGYQP